MANKYRAWVDGEVLTAANLIDYVQKNVVIPCDSSSDYPDSSTRREGMTVYDKNADKLLTYTTSTTGWVAPWNLPWGFVSLTQVTASTAATNANITTYSLAATANRRYRITAATGSVSSDVANDIAGLAITIGGTQYARVNIDCRTSATGANGSSTFAIYAPTASATVTVAAYGARVQGTGTINWGASATTPIQLLVEDIGPNGAPA